MQVLDQCAQNKLDTVTLFMHSWSFAKKWDEDKSKAQVDMEDIEDFREVLSFIKEHNGLMVLSFSEYHDRLFNNQIQLSNIHYVPSIMHKTNLINYLRKRLNIHKANIMSWMSYLSLFLFVLVFIGIVARKKTSGPH